MYDEEDIKKIQNVQNINIHESMYVINDFSYQVITSVNFM